MPEVDSSQPPPLPKAQVVTTSGRKTVLLALGAALVLILGGVVGFGVLYLATAREFEVTDEHRAAMHTAKDLAAWREFEVDETCETWRGERMFDGAVEIEYEYDDPREEAPYLNASLHYEPKASDSLTNFAVLWQSAKAGVGIGANGGMKVEEVQDFFSWGDASRFAFLTKEGARHGMLFCTRKGKRVYLLMIGGACIEERSDLEKFLRPKLEAVERLPFGRK